MAALALASGRGALAVELLEQALEADDRAASLHDMLAEALEREGREAEALVCRGNALRAGGDPTAACDRYWQALSLDAGLAGGYAGLGLALLDKGDSAAAVAALGQALALRPGHAASESGLGAALLAQGQPGEALDHFTRALTLDPRRAEAAAGLGCACHRLGDWDEAAACHERALSLRPELSMAHRGLALLDIDRGRLAAAVASAARAVATAPGRAEPLVTHGAASLKFGLASQAADAFRQAVALDPLDPSSRSGLILALDCDDQAAPAVAAAERRCVPAAPDAVTARHDRIPAPERCLRIGYVSPDLRRGALAPFLEPVLAAHDRGQVEIFCYAEVARPDLTTSRLKSRVDGWCDSVGLDDQSLGERVRADGVDILVDLAGHRPGNRLGLFALRPAPVQVSWLGYPDAPGLPAIDWRFTDGVIERENNAPDRLVRLPRGLCCWQPPEGAPDPVPRTGRAVTFGALAGPARLSPAVIAVWSALLARVPGSRLRIAAPAFFDPETAAALRARFGRAGADLTRVDLTGIRTGGPERLALLGTIDVALDTFPVCGPAALCDALWMGAPAVTLRGDRPCGRTGASLLTRCGLDALVAQDTGTYLDLATALARDAGRRAELGVTLRRRLLASPLCDAPGFTRALESAYRSVWRRWCRNAA